MSRDDIQKLLGGYATGTLTLEEQQALFEAALTDQELFDALAREEALREALSDPAARAQLLAAIDDAPAPWYRQWWRPAVVMAAALSMVVGVALWDRSPAPKPSTVAKVELPRFRPPAESRSAPLLPPPPELKPAAPVMRQLKLPAASPAAPPPPETKSDAFAINGSVSGSLQAPMQQSQAQAQLSPPAGNSFLPQASVPLRGTVTDPAGAVIPAASVAVKSLATGETTNTSTDVKGEFNASAVPGSEYLISASKPGFISTTVSQVTPVGAAPAPVNLRLDVGAVAETVEVTAGATAVPAPRAAGGGGGRGGAIGGLAPARMMTKVAPAPPPPIQYHLLRRIAGGDPVEVPANGTVPPGAALIIRITPAADGYLRIVPSTGSAIASPPVKRGVAFETTLPPFDQPGRVELRVYFSSQATESKDQSPALLIAFNIQ